MRQNVGTKFIFPRIAGFIHDSAVTMTDNDFFGFIVATDNTTNPSGPYWTPAYPGPLPGKKPYREALSHALQYQQRWTDSAGVAHEQFGWDPRQQQAACVRGKWCTVEFLYVMDSTVQTWVNDTLVRTQTGVKSPRWTPTGREVLTRYFGYVFSDMTFGGGYAIPPVDQWVDFREFYVSIGH
jgi:hypothetical protein